MNTMSKDAPERAPGGSEEWRRLESAVRTLLNEHHDLLRRLDAAEQRTHELEAALSALSTGRLDPVGLSDQVRSFERENRVLTQRIEQAKLAVERIQSRLHFLEEVR